MPQELMLTDDINTTKYLIQQNGMLNFFLRILRIFALVSSGLLSF